MGDFAKVLSESFRKTLYNPEIQLLTSEIAEDLLFPVSEEVFDSEENYLYLVESLNQHGPEYSVICDGELNIRACFDACGKKMSFKGENLKPILESAGYDLSFLDLEGLVYDEWYDDSSDEFVYLSDSSCTFDRVDLTGVYEALAENSDRISLSIRRYEEVEEDLLEYDSDDDEEWNEDGELFMEDDDEYYFEYDGKAKIRDMKYYIEVNSENGKEYFSEELPAFFYEDEEDEEAELDNVLDLQTLLFRQLRAMKKFGFVPTDQQLEKLVENAATGYPAIIFITKK